MAIDSSFKFIAYPLAMKRLAARWAATPEELAAWVWVGPKDSGLAAYRNANEIDPPSNDSTFLAGMSRAIYSSMHSADTSARWSSRRIVSRCARPAPSPCRPSTWIRHVAPEPAGAASIRTWTEPTLTGPFMWTP